MVDRVGAIPAVDGQRGICYRGGTVTLSLTLPPTCKPPDLVRRLQRNAQPVCADEELAGIAVRQSASYLRRGRIPVMVDVGDQESLDLVADGEDPYLLQGHMAALVADQ